MAALRTRPATLPRSASLRWQSAGRVAFVIEGSGLQYADSARAEMVYSSLRRWIKNSCSNNLKWEGSDEKIRMFWVGPAAHAKKLAQKNLVFKQFEQSISQFVIDERAG